MARVITGYFDCPEVPVPTLLLLLTRIALAGEIEGSVVGDITYEGGLDQKANGYQKGKAVTVSHSGGNISVRCMDTDTLSARLPYVVTGSSPDALEATGKGVQLKTSTDGKGGGVVSTLMPSKKSGVSSLDAPLTVNVPAGARAISISQSGSGWVQVTGCSGALSVKAGAGGAFASGQYSSVSMSATGGNVKVVQEGGAVLTGSTSLSAAGGNATLILASAQGGKLSAKGAQVAVQQSVMGGSQSDTAVSGSFGLDGPSISVSAKDNVEISAQ